MRGYLTAFGDWLACAVGGRGEPAAKAALALGDGLAERVIATGTAAVQDARARPDQMR